MTSRTSTFDLAPFSSGLEMTAWFTGVIACLVLASQILVQAV